MNRQYSDELSRRRIRTFFRRHHRGSVITLVLLLLVAATAKTDAVIYPFTTPVFGLAIAPDGSLLAADAGSGIVEIRKGFGSLLAPLHGVTDVAPIGRGDMFAITSRDPGGEGKLYRVSRGSVREIADLYDFEIRVNPDGNPVAPPPAPGPSNPFDVEALSGGSALVADAAGNSLLIVDQQGHIDWVATLPNEVVSTANGRRFVTCPGGPPPICSGATWPAQAVATSVAIGPDGAYYVGELKGMPAPTGESRVWRIEPGTLHARCGSSPACRVVADGFTSIIDLTFGPDGTLYVVELDEQSWFGMQVGQGTGGSVNACNSSTWACTQIATGIPMLMSATVGQDGSVYIVKNALIPGAADVTLLP
jgi:hypothetical protein